MKIGIVECGKSKAAGFFQRKAREMYTSPLFQKSLAHAQKHCDFVMILSSQYGLINPDDWIQPYNCQAESVELMYYGGKKKLPKVTNVLEGLFIGQRLQFLTEEEE